MTNPDEFICARELGLKHGLGNLCACFRCRKPEQKEDFEQEWKSIADFF